MASSSPPLPPAPVARISTAPPPLDAPPVPEAFLRARSEGWFGVLGKRLADGKWVFSDRTLARLVSEEARSDQFCDPGEEEDGSTPKDKAEEEEQAAAAAVVISSSFWRCGICLEDMNDKEFSAAPLCPRKGCAEEHRFCQDCLGQYFGNAVEQGRYAVRPMRCPAPGCGRRVPTERWRPLVPPKTFDGYSRSAHDLFVIRCPSCDENLSLFVGQEVVLPTGEAREKALDAFLRELRGGLSEEELEEQIRRSSLSKTERDSKVGLGAAAAGRTEQVYVGPLFVPPPAGEEVKLRQEEALRRSSQVRELRMVWGRFASGRCGPETVLAALFAADSDLGGASEEGPAAEGEQPRWHPDRMAKILELVTDLERRAALQLAYLRWWPKIYTPCCDAPMCFKCKVEGHHEGLTCEERQRQEATIDCQFCPGCGVPTQRTEGCTHMICLCGEHWTWQNNEDDDE